MKKFMTTLVLLCILFVSCKMDYDIIKRDSNLVSISVDISAAKKTSYYVSESFDSTGIKVIAHYTDGTSKEVDIEQVTFDNFSSESPNPTLPITVIYQELSTTFNVSIKENEITRISVVQLPKKLHYQKSEGTSQKNLDLDGLIVEGYDSLGKRTILDEKEYDVLNFSINNAIQQTKQNVLSIVYKKNQTITTNFNIYFDDLTVTNVKIKNQPYKKYFLIGTVYPDYTGLEVLVNSEKILSEAEYAIIPAELSDLAVGEYGIEVWVNGQHDTFQIEIVDEYLAGIGIDNIYEDKTLYYKGNSIELITAFSIYERFNDKNGELNIRKESITSATYNQSRSEKVLKYSYNNDIGFDEATEIMDADGKPNQIKLDTIGKNTIYFYYRFKDINNELKTITYPLEIIVGEPLLESISATWEEGEKGGYPLGVNPDNSNLKYGKWKEILLKYADDTTKTVPANTCSFEYKEGEIDKIKDDVLKGTPMDCPVVVKYADKICETNVKVVCPEVIGITAELNEEEDKPIRKGESNDNLKKYITVSKVLQYIQDKLEVTDKEKISVIMYENQNEQNKGVLVVNYDTSFSAFVNINITKPRIDLSQNDITVSVNKDLSFKDCKGSLKILKNDIEITNQLELDVKEEYAETAQKKWFLCVNARQNPEAYGDTINYTNLTKIESNYDYTQEDNPKFNIDTIEVSRIYQLGDYTITKKLRKNRDFFIKSQEDKYYVIDLEGNEIVSYKNTAPLEGAQ